MKAQTRKLTDTSWLAQSVMDMAAVEYAKNGESGKYKTLKTLRFIVQCADESKLGMFFSNNRDGRQIFIPTIPSGMQPEFLGMAELYQDEKGYTVHVMTTHNLNSAEISISRLMDAIRLGA